MMPAIEMPEGKPRPKILDIVLNEFQKEFLRRVVSEDGKTIVSARAGWGSGKSLALVLAAHLRACVYPNERILVLTDTANRWRSVLAPLFAEWLEPIGYRYEASRNCYIAPTGAVIVIKSWFNSNTSSSPESNPIEGITCGIALLDEMQTFSPIVYSKVAGRVRGSKNPKICMVGLPIYQSFWCDIAIDAGCKPLFYSSYVNKQNLSQAWFDTLATLPLSERKAFVDGEPQMPTGVVFPSFNPLLHVLTDFKYDQTELGILTCDWGYRNPCLQIWIESTLHDSAWVLVWEYNGENQKVSQLISLLKQTMISRDRFNTSSEDNRGKFVIDYWTGDRSGQNKSDRTGTSIYREIGEEIGLKPRLINDPVRMNIMNGIRLVTSLIENDKILINEDVFNKGKDNPKSFRNSIASYRWKESEDIPEKDNIHDHSIDALRYACVSLRWRNPLSPLSSKSSPKSYATGVKHQSTAPLAPPTAPVHKPKPTTSMPYMPPPTALPNKKRLSF